MNQGTQMMLGMIIIFIILISVGYYLKKKQEKELGKIQELPATIEAENKKE